jgi:hypothetical protein
MSCLVPLWHALLGPLYYYNYTILYYIYIYMERTIKAVFTV